ncbi:hypothetical protein B0H17DRAFT_1291940 [Mycena rosella]|uniref:Uncharacterized protein n=1 Tax=Mycena rosella TaxID=1033263 RepID=A0AAD7DHP3_MYCRO|nr:hypothetical protein B0H17DRAFT_1291940 [Mycena rosella]
MQNNSKGRSLVDTGCVRSVVSHRLKISFGPRQTPAGDPLEIVFKSRGPALEEVVTVLRKPIIGNAGTNLRASAIRSLAECSNNGVLEGQGGRKAVGKKSWDGKAEKVAF